MKPIRSAGKRGSILLVQPGERGGQDLFGRLWQPLDLANSAARLEHEGFHVRIIDNRVENIRPSQIARIGNGFDKIFVTSAAFDRWQCPPVAIPDFFRITDPLEKNKLYIMGPHVTERPETFLKKTRARAAILGEPENSLVSLSLNDQGGEMHRDLCNIAYLDNDGMVQISKQGPGPSHHRTWPRPAFHLLDMKRYHYPLMKRPFTILEGSRGCPFQCRFCYKGMHPSVFVQKNPMDLVDEVLGVRDRSGISNIYFMDLEFGVNTDFLREFCMGMIRQNTGINWCCQMRVTDADDELLQLMHTAGCSLIHFGAETATQRLLDWSGKNIRLCDCEKAVMGAKRANIRTALFFSLGFPNESPKEMDDTVNWAVGLNPTYASFHMLMPVPGTHLQRSMVFNPESLPHDRYPTSCAEGHDELFLRKKVRHAYVRFYSRPRYLLGALRDQGILKRRAFEFFLRGIGCR
ncbi:MAG: B12-binding domain-containing radical SAM protein [Proteobacteria bacterium]|nr:B12-binding domain-containing radical SAM protein [Pseudomonadota bacterium]